MQSPLRHGLEHQVHGVVDLGSWYGLEESGADPGIEHFGYPVAGEHAG
ncbi:hypothetical protein [Actinopolymorpha pittospori]